jgi:hypothetical protein
MLSVCQQINSLHATAHIPDDGPSETETCGAVVEEGHEMGMIKSGIAQKAAPNTGFVCMYVYIYINNVKISCNRP